MAEFRPILDAVDLPVPNHERESNVLDFKGYVPFTTEPQKIEAAKDLASFANADGGSIIYGAVEGAGGVLASYAGVPDEQTAERFRTQLRDIASSKCSPPLTIDVRRLKLSTVYGGGFVIVANVFPAPGQATGVTLPWSTRQSGKQIDSYFFPIRLGDSSEPEILNPEQIAMLMIPKLRRVLAALRQIEPGDRVVFRGRHTSVTGKLVDLDADKNYVVIEEEKVREGKNKQYPHSLDMIESVWRNPFGDDPRVPGRVGPVWYVELNV